MANKPKHQDPSCKLIDIDKKHNALRAETNAIFATPKPKPAEKPKEEAKNEDVPMNESQPSEEKKDEQPQAEQAETPQQN